MNLTRTERDGVAILAIEGKLMGSPEESSLKITIIELADAGKTKVVLDLSELDWMNSLGLGMCIAGLTTLRNRGGDLRLVNPPEQLVSLMKKCHLYTLFRTFDSVDKAVGSF
jgi:anti-sigma B factor antagonist